MSNAAPQPIPITQAQFDSRFSVYVVDDESVIATTVALILRQHGFHATAFTRPEQVIDACKHKAPDALISDVAMPGFSGFELALWMRERCADCKVVLFSGQAASLSLPQAMIDAGLELEIMSKPIHPRVLIAQLTALLRKT